MRKTANLDLVATAKVLAELNKIPTATVSRREINDAAANAGLPFPRFIVWTPTVQRGRWENFTMERATALGIGYKATGRGRAAAIAVHSGHAKATTPRVTRPRNYPAPVSVPAPVAMAVPNLPAPTANAVLDAAISAGVGTDLMLAPSEHAPFVPARSAGYVPYGHFDTVAKVMASRHFLPVMIVGPSGNGKTDMVEQAAASAAREFVRCNITNQTDEDDLLGGFRLIDGNMRYALGPVPMAMLSGGVLLLDEIDLGTAPLMCLQPVLEGKPLFLKKIGRYIHPAPGFTIFATANTKGRGDDGRYAHTNIMNEAMLERFAVMFDQSWAPADVERKILNHILRADGKADATLARHLVEFANTTRTQYAAGTCNDQIATRRLIHIVRTVCTLGAESINEVMKLTLARFDETTAEGFMTLWHAIHDEKDASPSGAPIAVNDEAAAF